MYYIYILFQILFPFKLLQSIEQSSLCYTVGPCWLSILNTAVCTCQSQTGLGWGEGVVGEGVDDAGEQRKNCW